MPRHGRPEARIRLLGRLGGLQDRLEGEHAVGGGAVADMDDVLDRGKVPEDMDLNDHCALIDKLGASGRLQVEVSERVRVNLASYFLALPSEPAMKLWTVIGQANSDLAIAMHSTEVKGKSVGAYLVEILTGKEIQ